MSKPLIPDRGPVAPVDYEISPDMIDASEQFLNCFGLAEIESAAAQIVQLCQRLNGWRPFSAEDIAPFFPEDPCPFVLDGLVEPMPPTDPFSGWSGGGWVVRGSDGLFRVTIDFIQRCHAAAPRAVGDA